MGIEHLLNGEELITKQNNVIKDLPTKGLKEFSPNNSWIEKKQIEKKLEERFNFINTERIEKRSNLSVAEWVPYLGKAKVLKKTGKLWESIGHHQNNEDWLLPEEVLFLVENCELELILNNVSASIEDCYALLLSEELCSLDEYRVYSYLCRAGLRVIRHSPTITVTPYEQQVNLDTIMQQSKRSPPNTSSMKVDDGTVVCIDEVNILTDSPEKEAGDNSIKPNISSDEVIEIEDDIDQNCVVEELLESSDDSSDIICISSPSYSSTERCRLWYPTVKQCLLRSMEKVIDLCNDDSPTDYKQLIHRKLDLIKLSKTEVLSLLPSAVNGVTILHSPDCRLLPSNIVPKYSEYKVNLNIRSDYPISNNFRPYYYPGPRMPFRNIPFNPQMNPELMTNPLFRKAEEMQAMAMNMIQTASTLMSVLSSQNPNELWNLVDGRSQEVRFRPRFRDFQQQRPYFQFPRRNYRAMRRRYPYDKRGGGRYFRRFNNAIDQNNSTKEFTSEVKLETVVLSDDDDDSVIKHNSFKCELDNSKRKRMDSETISKKVKTESNDPLLVSEEYCSNEKNFDAVILTESNDNQHSEVIHDKCCSIKKESCDLIDCIEVDEITNNKQSENDYRTKILSGMALISKTNQESTHLVNETLLKPNEQVIPATAIDESKNMAYNKINKEKARSEIQDDNKMSPEIVTEKTNEQNITKGSCKSAHKSLDIIDVGLSKNDEYTVFHNQNNMSSELSLNHNEIAIRTEKITTWEEYKNIEESQLGIDEEGGSESVLRLEDCSNYDNILRALQIFKSVNLKKKRKKTKISFDVYLPGTNFRKSLKLLPNFRVIILKSSEDLPTPMDMQCLKTEYQDQIPFLFTIVFNETVGFYQYDTFSLPPILE